MNQENEFSSRAGQRTVTAGQLLLVLTEILEARGGRDVDVGIDLGNKDYRTIVGYQYAPIGEGVLVLTTLVAALENLHRRAGGAN
jgi:hypothetical protein